MRGVSGGGQYDRHNQRKKQCENGSDEESEDRVRHPRPPTSIAGRSLHVSPHCSDQGQQFQNGSVVESDDQFKHQSDKDIFGSDF
jgi:hypothetical protein